MARKPRMEAISRNTRGGLRGCLALLGAASVLWACARPGRPPGGPEDRIPPMVVTTWPDTFQTIDPTRDPVVIRFSERISERPTLGRLEDAVLVSPVTGEAQVKHTRSGLEVSVIGGFQENLVYRVRVLNTVKDMFNNQMETPFELVFSTGGEYEAHVLAGVITDRITGEKVDQARVEAREIVEGEDEDEGEESSDGPIYMAKTDTAGIYVLRYVPSGNYEITIYQDNNRNGEPDFPERQGSTTAHLGLLASRKDTIIREIALLQPDTTDAELIRIEAQDSALLNISFDDFLMPGRAIERARVTISREEGESPGIERLLWQHELDSLRAFNDSIRAADSLQAVTDSLQVVADSLEIVTATLRAAGDTVDLPALEGELETLLDRLAPPEPREPEEEEEPEPPPPILPEPSFYAILDGPLTPGQLYTLTLENVQNVNGLRNGGGEAGVTWEPPEEEGEDLPPDTSAAAPPDTASVPPDTSRVPPDTTGIPSEPATPPPEAVLDPPDRSRIGQGAIDPFLHRRRGS